jgi:CRISPR-associated RAMP protein (TIGR02581 family)
MARWDTFASRLVIGGRLEAMSGLRIGAGGVEAAQPSASDLPVLVGGDGRPYIPGASLRGVLRSFVERVVRTLEPQSGQGRAWEGRGACNPVVEAEWCISREAADAWRQEARRDRDANGDADFADKVWSHSCRVCRVFGNTLLASRVRIADLPLLGDDPPRVERRDGVAIDRDKETVANKYDFEALVATSAFDLYIIAENLDAAERGLLLLGVRELSAGNLQVGGFKGRGLGWVKLETPSVQIVDAGDRAQLRAFLLQGTMQTVVATEQDAWSTALWNELEGANA